MLKRPFALAAYGPQVASVHPPHNVPIPRGAAFDGTNDYMAVGGVPTGLADGKAGTVSFWIRMTGADATTYRIAATTNARFEVVRTTGNVVQVLGRNTGNTLIMVINNTGGAATPFTLVNGGWNHFLASWNLAVAGARRVFVNGVDRTTASTFTDDTIDYTNTNFAVGATPGAANKLAADLAEFWFNPTFLDLTDAANVAKFFSGNRAEYLGATGQLPLGSDPLIYQSVRDADAATVFAANKGTGGNFSITGALDLVAGPNG